MIVARLREPPATRFRLEKREIKATFAFKSCSYAEPAYAGAAHGAALRFVLFMIYRFDYLQNNSINPVTGRPFDDRWIIVQLTESADYCQHCGMTNGNVYTVFISKRNCPNWQMDIGDCFSFYQAEKRNLVVVITESEYAEVLKIYKQHRFSDPYLRAYEPRVLVHSTPMEHWIQIQEDGKLKCWNQLKTENKIIETAPIGRILGDPVEFSDYIMFGTGQTGEFVVLSKQKGIISTDCEEAYSPGARLYFDAEKIARDGLLIRDGTHLKVKGELSLNPYLLWAATRKELGLDSKQSTPKEFAQTADTAFHNRFL